MTPGSLRQQSFAEYPPLARKFAIEHLPLLQALPLAVCPSFLKEIRTLDTSFPAEQAMLRWQCEALAALAPVRLQALTAPLAALRMSATLEKADWVHAPAEFIAALTAYLWSSGQLDAFRSGTQSLFAAIPTRQDNTQRLVAVVFGRDLEAPAGEVLRKLRKHGTRLTALQGEDTLAELGALWKERLHVNDPPYAHWYVDGAEGVPALSFASSAVTVLTYAGVGPLRQRVLQRMERTLAAGNSGPEQMRDRLAATTPEDVGGATVTKDPILQRFFTELFTESSGPQIFSTSFVQWSGREIARRVQPTTLIVRYTARQRNHDMNQLLTDLATLQPDPQGSFRDAEMGAYYHWLEMNRITAPGRLTFIALRENSPQAVVISARAPAGSDCTTPMSLSEALRAFG